MKLQKEMLEIVEILNQVESTNARNEKIETLSDNKENQLLQKVFLYAYSPYKIYGLGKKSLEGVEESGIAFVQSKFTDIFELLDYLQTVNVNDEIRGEVVSFLMTTPLAIRSLYIKMILKDLRIGATATIANKVWKELVPKFEIMQGKKYEDYKDKIKGKTIIITNKYDGYRMVAIKQDGEVKLMSRQGKRFEGCLEIEEELKRLPDNMVYDGEILKANPEGLSSKDLYSATKKVVDKDGEKTGLEFHIFDMLPLSEFEAGKSKKKCLERKRDLSEELSNTDYRHLKKVPILYVGEDPTMVDKLLKEAISNEEEGLMVNLDEPYECKRSNQLLKVKKMFFADLRVTNILEGDNKYKGKLGAITVQFEHLGELYECNCGSGFSDHERDLYYNNPELILDKIVEIQYFEISQNEGKDDSSRYGLRFPIWKGNIRHDKDEISMY